MPMSMCSSEWKSSRMAAPPTSTNSFWAGQKPAMCVGPSFFKSGAKKLKDTIATVTKSASKKRTRPLAPTWRILHFDNLVFNPLNNAPHKPPNTPMAAKIGSSQIWYFWLKNLPNSTGTSVPSVPQARMPSMGPAKKRTVRDATAAQTKVRTMIRGFMCEAPSSTAKSTPPMGAPKAAATPAAAPAAMKSRDSADWRNGAMIGPAFIFAACAATMAPLWIIGPSFPHGRPAPTLQTMPKTFAPKVRSFRTFGKSMPLSTHLISGMPLPPAKGSTKQTRAAATEARTMLVPIHTRYRNPRPTSMSKSHLWVSKLNSLTCMSKNWISTATPPATSPTSTRQSQRKPPFVLLARAVKLLA
mmetsp:Transcript_9527/g.33771  ORF Transcript_9527/g.33771 Transcript_9527/m.33771 type:complete len:357 (+) Transcript_9527:1046-2116(+)